MENFLKLAYEKAIIEYLRGHLTDTFLAAGGTKTEMLCDEAPYAHKNVTVDAISDFILRLQEEETNVTQELRKYKYARKNVRLIARPVDPSSQCPQPRSGCFSGDRAASSSSDTPDGHGASET
jgi:hypothetical protein